MTADDAERQMRALKKALAEGWLNPADPLVLEAGQLAEAQAALRTASDLLSAFLVTFGESGLLEGVRLFQPRLLRVLNALEHQFQLLESGLLSDFLKPPPDLAANRKHPETFHPQLRLLPALASAAEEVLAMTVSRKDARTIICEILTSYGVSRSPRTIKKYSEETPKDFFWQRQHRGMLTIAKALSLTDDESHITLEGAIGGIRVGFSPWAGRMAGFNKAPP